ncbi:MAG: hypothetical protein QM743_02560 [Chitinophagaceae bacterium]
MPQNNNNNNNNGGGGTTTYQSFSREFEQLAPRKMTKSIDAAAGASFYGYSGTRYVFPANAFQTASGTVVTGMVDLQVMECVKIPTCFLRGCSLPAAEAHCFLRAL